MEMKNSMVEMSKEGVVPVEYSQKTPKNILNYNLSINNHININELVRLADYLKVEFPGSRIMPAREGGKNPMFKHMNQQYSWENFGQTHADQYEHGALILLPRELIVIDIDDKDECIKFEKNFPEFKQTVTAITKKGKHYYFQRVPRCDEIKMLDGARQLIDDIPLDVKTICSTGTSGVISIFPNKTWERPMGVTTLLKMSDGFLDYFIKNRASSNKNRVSKDRKDKGNKPAKKVTFEYLEELVMGLDEERSKEYPYWIYCVYGIHNTSIENNFNIQKTIDLIHRFSSKSEDAYNFDLVEHAISELKYNAMNVKVRNLKKMLKYDNFELYCKLHPVDVNLEIVKKCFTEGVSNDKIANLYYESHISEFLWTGAWYQKTEYNVYNALSDKYEDEMVKDFMVGKVKRYTRPYIDNYKKDFMEWYNEMMKKEDDQQKQQNQNQTKKQIELQELLAKKREATKECLPKKLKEFTKSYNSIIKNMETKTFIDKCYDVLKEKYLNMQAGSLMDSYPHLLGCNNGVLDTIEHVFRLPRNNEYVSMSVGFDFEVIDFKEMEEFIDDTMHDMDTSHHHKKYLGSLLEGGCKDQKVYFWVGTGANSKGATDRFVKGGMGDYYTIMPVGLYCSYEKDAERASPAKGNLKGKRIGMCSETDAKTKFVTANFNSLSGGDDLKTRGLYSKKTVEFKALYKSIIQTNNLPLFTDINLALFRRIFVLCFPWMYMTPDEYDSNNPLHKLRDDAKIERIQNNNGRLQMLNLMWHYLQVQKKEGLIPSAYIKEKTETYKKDLDVIKGWVMENLEVDGMNVVSIKEVFERFISNQEDPDFKFMKQKTFTEKLPTDIVVQRKFYGGKQQPCVMGYVLKSEGDDLE